MKSNKQTCVALSTAEAEYVALSAAAQEAVWLGPFKISFSDNQSAICLAKNQQTHGRTKHIDIKYHFIRELVETGRIKLAYCPSADMVADILTKGLPAQQFKSFMEMLASWTYKLFLPRVRSVDIRILCTLCWNSSGNCSFGIVYLCLTLCNHYIISMSHDHYII